MNPAYKKAKKKLPSPEKFLKAKKSLGMNDTEAIRYAGFTGGCPRRAASNLKHSEKYKKLESEFVEEIKKEIKFDAQTIAERLWSIQAEDGQDRVQAIARLQKQLGLEAVQKSEVKIDAPALTAELGRLLGFTIK